MSADTSDLTKTDSAVSGLSSSPTDTKSAAKGARKSSSYPGVFNINDLGKEKSASSVRSETNNTRKGRNQDRDRPRNPEIELVRSGSVLPNYVLTSDRKLNTSTNEVDDPTVLKKHLTTPPVKKIDLHFPLGLEVSARNLKGVTIKDALDAIHKQFKKKVTLSQSQNSNNC